MKTTKIFSIGFKVLVLTLLISCSGGDEADEKGSIEQATDKIAQEATDMIKKPLNEAKRVAEIANDRSRQVEEAKQQE